MTYGAREIPRPGSFCKEDKKMENKRNELAAKMEIVGQIFEIDGMTELLLKFEKGMNSVKFNAVVIQISALLLKSNKALADKILAMAPDMDDQKVQEMEDGEYAQALRNAILTDVMGFFASSPRSDGRK